MFKYTPLYANGKEPVIEEQDVYRIEIPYIPTLQGSEIDTTQKSTQKSTQKILDLIRENPYVTTQEMADSIGIIRRSVAKHIKSLQEKGKIKRIGPDKGGHWEVIDWEERSLIDIIAEAFKYGLDPTDEKQRRMATAYLLEEVSWTGMSEFKAGLTASRTRQLCDAMTVSKDMMANLLLATGGRSGISTGGGGSTNELTNWDGTKKKTGWGR